MNIAILQKNIRDYSGSESSTIQALKVVIPLNEHKQIYIGYNNLAILYNQLSEFNIARDYHFKALNSARKLNDSYLEANTLNNIGVVYEKMGQFKKAIAYYKKALEIDSLKLQHVRLYAMLKDNLAYSQMKLGPTQDLSQSFFEALELREENGHEAGIVANKLHLGEYFLLRADTARAREYFLEANQLSTEVQLHRDVLQSLVFLAQVEPNNSSEYLNSYVTLNDSLDRAERAAKNRFMRIQLETDEYIAENEQLNREKLWILGGAGGAIGLLALTFLFWKQKARNRRLLLEQDQRKANEEIYNLLLDQESRVEEGRKKEKSRISKELHDGVLSNLYGIRFNLSNLISKTDDASLEKKGSLVSGLRSIEEEIRTISRDLHNRSEFTEAGFINLVENFVEEQRDIMKAKVIFKKDQDIPWARIESKQKMNLFRIIQEGVQNIRKYSRASEFAVIFTQRGEEMLQMEIMDNGIGFDVQKNHSGIGLKNIKDRVKSFGGKTEIDSGSTGTRITIEIPLSYVQSS